MIHGRKKRWMLPAVILIFCQLGITACSKTAGETPKTLADSLPIQTAEATPGSGETAAERESNDASGETEATNATVEHNSQVEQTGSVDQLMGEFVDANGDVNLMIEKYISNGDSYSYYRPETGQNGSPSSPDTANTSYNPGDIAVINAIIDNNHLAAAKNDPANWGFATWNKDSTGKRISRLYLEGNGLTGQLDLSGLSALENLDCSHNQIQTLDISGTNLTFLNCSENPLTKLTGVSHLSGLETLYCAHNQFQSLDLTNMTALTTLSCSNSRLQHLNLTGLTALTKLNCAGNQLKALDMSSLTALVTLDCSANPLTSLTGLSSLSSLQKLDCSSGQLQTLDVSGLTALTALDCHKNQLTGLTGLSGLTSLTALNCGQNQLAALDISGLSALDSLTTNNLPLTLFKGSGRELKVSAGTGGAAVINYISPETNQARLTAMPDPGYSFKSWKGLPGDASNTPNTLFSLTDSLDVTAVFEPFSKTAPVPK